MASISSHSNESGKSAEPQSPDADPATLYQSEDVSSPGRFIRLVIYEQGKKNDIRRIWVYERSTYGDIGRALGEEMNSNVSYALLEAIWGPWPYWAEADPDTPLGGTCQVLYAVVKRDGSRYILGMVRTSKLDYPIPIYDEAYGSSRTVSQAIVASHPSLTSQIKSIIGYSDNEDLKDSQYSYDSLRRYRSSMSPAVVITLDEPFGEFMTDLSNCSILPILQRPFIYCRHLIEQAHDLDRFALQMIHVASSLLHIIVSLAKTTEAVLVKDGPGIDEALDANDGLGDSLRLTPVLARDIEELLDAFNQIMENIRSCEESHAQIHDSIQALFSAACGDYPGAVTIRHSCGTFQALLRVDHEEEARDLTRPVSNIQQVAATGTVQPATTAIIAQQLTTAGVIQNVATASVSTGDEVPKKRTLKQRFREALSVTGLSRQHGRDRSHSPIPSAARGKEKGKDKAIPAEETSRSLGYTFRRRPKVAFQSATTDKDDRPAPRSQEPRRRALLIGILYETDGDWDTLQTTYNDNPNPDLPKDGYSDDGIKIASDCHDAAEKGYWSPTIYGLRKALSWLVDGASRGDNLFVHYSGHGHQIVADSYLEVGKSSKSPP